MEKKKGFGKRLALPALIVLVMIGLLFVCVRRNADVPKQVSYEENPVGMTQQEMWAENDTYREDNRVCRGDIGDTMAVFLQHREDLTDMDADIYVNKAEKWFRYCRMTGNKAEDQIYQLVCEDNEEYVLLYFGTGSISYIEAEKEDGSSAVYNPEMGKPFTCVMKHSWHVTVYDMDGNEIEPEMCVI